MTTREEAIQAFVKVNEVEENLTRVISAIAAQNPAAIMVFWEGEDGYGAITIPHSRALAYGLAIKAYELLVETEEDVDTGGDDSTELVE